MWLAHRLSRLQHRFRHLTHYLRTLPQANRIERQTDFSQCRRPVLLLYGLGATRRSMKILEARLRRDGFDVFSLNLGGLFDLFNTAAIDRAAHQVAEKIESLCRRHRLPALAIIGYSKGGLIGRYYVTQLGGGERVHTLITLATPHQGNPWLGRAVWLGFPWMAKGLRQMAPRSRWLKTLNQTEPPPHLYLVSIASRKDRHCPPRYCTLPFAGNGRPIQNVVLDHLTHSDFIIKHRAYETVREHLQNGFAAYEQTAAENGPPPRRQTEGCSNNNKSTAAAGQTR